MNTLLVIKWSSVAMAATALIAFGILIFIASYGIAKLHRKKFILQYETLKDFINKAPVDQKNYDAIRDMFNETYCYSDEDVRLIKHLWNNFRAKFHSIVPVEDKDLFSDNKEYTSKNASTSYRKLKHKSKVELIKS